ncbi:hypothetical protein L345_17259, partial [Ophiophagus hannah]
MTKGHCNFAAGWDSGERGNLWRGNQMLRHLGTLLSACSGAKPPSWGYLTGVCHLFFPAALAPGASLHNNPGPMESHPRSKTKSNVSLLPSSSYDAVLPACPFLLQRKAENSSSHFFASPPPELGSTSIWKAAAPIPREEGRHYWVLGLSSEGGLSQRGPASSGSGSDPSLKWAWWVWGLSMPGNRAEAYSGNGRCSPRRETLWEKEGRKRDRETERETRKEGKGRKGEREKAIKKEGR